MLGGGVLDAVAGGSRLGGLERGRDRGQLVEAEPVSGGDVADRVRRQAADLESVGLRGRQRRAVCGQQGRQRAPASGDATTTPRPPVECLMKSSIEVSARMRPWPMISR